MNKTHPVTPALDRANRRLARLVKDQATLNRAARPEAAPRAWRWGRDEQFKSRRQAGRAIRVAIQAAREEVKVLEATKPEAKTAPAKAPTAKAIAKAKAKAPKVEDKAVAKGRARRAERRALANLALSHLDAGDLAGFEGALAGLGLKTASATQLHAIANGDGDVKAA